MPNGLLVTFRDKDGRRVAVPCFSIIEITTYDEGTLVTYLAYDEQRFIHTDATFETVTMIVATQIEDSLRLLGGIR